MKNLSCLSWYQNMSSFAHSMHLIVTAPEAQNNNWIFLIFCVVLFWFLSCLHPCITIGCFHHVSSVPVSPLINICIYTPSCVYVPHAVLITLLPLEHYLALFCVCCSSFFWLAWLLINVFFATVFRFPYLCLFLDFDFASHVGCVCLLFSKSFFCICSCLNSSALPLHDTNIRD